MRRIFMSVTAAALTCGCNHHVFSPPARVQVLESAATVGQGWTGIQVEGSDHGTILGPDITTGDLRARHGLSEAVDVSLESTWIHVRGDSAAGENKNVFAGRAGTKLAVAHWLSVGGGLGGGYSAGGPFASPDIGATVAWENGYLVPFYGLRGLVSIPIDARSVDTTEAGTDPGTHTGTPRVTWGVGSAMGLRVPLPPGAGELKPNDIRGNVLVGWGFLRVADSEEGESFAGLAAAAELVF